MHINLRDQVSIKVHQWLHGNVSEKTANRLAYIIMNTESIENVNGGVIRALQRKDSTSQKRKLPQVAAALSYIAAKKSSAEQYKRLASAEKVINYTKNAMDNYFINRHSLADKIESCFSEDLKHQAAEDLLVEYGLEMNDAKKFKGMLNDLKYIWGKAVAELEFVREKRDGISRMGGATWEDHREMLTYDREYTSLLAEIITLENNILDMEEKVEHAQYAKATIIFRVAGDNLKKLPTKCAEMVKDANILEARVNHAPEIVTQHAGRMAESERHRDNAEAFAERVGGVYEALRKTTSDEDTRNILNYFDEVNDRARKQDVETAPTTLL